MNSVAQDCLSFLTEEALHTDAFTEETGGIDTTVDALSAEFSSNLIDQDLLQRALAKAPVRASYKKQRYSEDVSALGVCPATYTSCSYVLGAGHSGNRVEADNACK